MSLVVIMDGSSENAELKMNVESSVIEDLVILLSHLIWM